MFNFYHYIFIVSRLYHMYVFFSTLLLYRVSIKSFPDYKNLLQENYVEYKEEHMLKCTDVL